MMNPAMGFNFSLAHTALDTQVQEEMKKAPIISSDSLICPTYFPAGTPCYQYLVHFHSVSLYELLPHCSFTENKLILLSLELGETKKDVLVILSRVKKSGNPIELWSKQNSRPASEKF